jgi:hypothetical protein
LLDGITGGIGRIDSQGNKPTCRLAEARLPPATVAAHAAGDHVVPPSPEYSTDSALTCVAVVSRSENGLPAGARLEPSKSPVVLTVGTASGSSSVVGLEVNVHAVVTLVERADQGRSRFASRVSVYRPVSAGSVNVARLGNGWLSISVPSRASVALPWT